MEPLGIFSDPGDFGFVDWFNPSDLSPVDRAYDSPGGYSELKPKHATASGSKLIDNLPLCFMDSIALTEGGCEGQDAR